MTRQLEHLAGAYFHQDYDLESGSVDSVIDLFREEESEASVAELLSEIDRLLASRESDRALRELWVVNWGASFDPVDGGHDMRNWLTAVRDRLSKGPR
ncbi:contact-dependent growth inhibition system immunity protein [Terracoccus sp. 273MFTsu3.1]|uniref:contact-dependent growth inhibition system immunity protein n=1 Tax=Terracoccus sp. 273MFTsu3.1 TaxID=1172188 RepID=UPI0003632868|nr:contact-dependent growth inhibition system immunity protein [Terracoccus sp. 273MFTsu3.1]